MITRVYADPYPDWNFRHVPHLERAYGAENVQGHVCDLGRMLVTVPLWKARSHHVSISNGFDL